MMGLKKRPENDITIYFGLLGVYNIQLLFIISSFIVNDVEK
jgi:hypothetical protein